MRNRFFNKKHSLFPREAIIPGSVRWKLEYTLRTVYTTFVSLALINSWKWSGRLTYVSGILSPISAVMYFGLCLMNTWKCFYASLIGSVVGTLAGATHESQSLHIFLIFIVTVCINRSTYLDQFGKVIAGLCFMVAVLSPSIIQDDISLWKTICNYVGMCVMPYLITGLTLLFPFPKLTNNKIKDILHLVLEKVIKSVELLIDAYYYSERADIFLSQSHILITEIETLIDSLDKLIVHVQNESVIFYSLKSMPALLKSINTIISKIVIELKALQAIYPLITHNCTQYAFVRSSKKALNLTREEIRLLLYLISHHVRASYITSLDIISDYILSFFVDTNKDYNATQGSLSSIIQDDTYKIVWDEKNTEKLKIARVALMESLRYARERYIFLVMTRPKNRSYSTASYNPMDSSYHSNINSNCNKMDQSIGSNVNDKLPSAKERDGPSKDLDLDLDPPSALQSNSNNNVKNVHDGNNNSNYYRSSGDVSPPGKIKRSVSIQSQNSTSSFNSTTVYNHIHSLSYYEGVKDCAMTSLTGDPKDILQYINMEKDLLVNEEHFCDVLHTPRYAHNASRNKVVGDDFGRIDVEDLAIELNDIEIEEDSNIAMEGGGNQTSSLENVLYMENIILGLQNHSPRFSFMSRLLNIIDLVFLLCEVLGTVGRDDAHIVHNENVVYDDENNFSRCTRSLCSLAPVSWGSNIFNASNFTVLSYPISTSGVSTSASNKILYFIVKVLNTLWKFICDIFLSFVSDVKMLFVYTFEVLKFILSRIYLPLSSRICGIPSDNTMSISIECWTYLKTFIHPFKIALSATLLSLFVVLPKMHEKYPYGLWAAVVMMLIRQDNSSSSFHTGYQRIEGTVVGSVFAYLSSEFLLCSAPRCSYGFQIFVLVMWLGLCAYFREGNNHGYAAIVAGFTPVVLLLGPTEGSNAGAWGRIEMTMIGVGVYLLVDNLILPNRSDMQLRTKLIENIQLIKTILIETSIAIEGLVSYEHIFTETKQKYDAKVNEISSDISQDTKGYVQHLIEAEKHLTSFSANIATQRSLLVLAIREPELWYSPFPAAAFERVLHCLEDSLLSCYCLCRATQKADFIICQLHESGNFDASNMQEKDVSLSLIFNIVIAIRNHIINAFKFATIALQKASESLERLYLGHDLIDNEELSSLVLLHRVCEKIKQDVSGIFREDYKLQDHHLQSNLNTSLYVEFTIHWQNLYETTSQHMRDLTQLGMALQNLRNVEANAIQK